jgi:hypothetical protein
MTLEVEFYSQLKKINKMKGYKAFNSNFTCRDYKFSENSEHFYDGEPILCEQGFHFCTEMVDCFKYYPLDKDIILCEVEALGDIVSESDNSKHVTNHIKILNRVNMTFDELLIECSNHKDYSVRYAVAMNPDTSIELLDKLSYDEDWAVIESVAENQNTSINTLTKLSNDDIVNVRYAVARNPNTSIELLIKSSNDDHWFVRLAVASNPNISIEMLDKLSDDENEDVRNAVAKNPNYKK